MCTNTMSSTVAFIPWGIQALVQHVVALLRAWEAVTALAGNGCRMVEPEEVP